jgi:hypothetical protein
MAIQKQCDITASLLLHYDEFFSCMRLTKEEVNNQSVTEARTFISNGMQLLRALQMSVTPKAHACESHAIAQMEEEKGMGDYDEDFVKWWHQEGKRKDVQTRAMRERAKRFVNLVMGADEQKSGGELYSTKHQAGVYACRRYKTYKEGNTR